MNFINLPVAFRGRRRLIQVPSGKISNKKLNAGYDPNLDATIAELPYKGQRFSLILILPGKQTEFIAGGLSRIESRLNVTLWNGLLRQMSPHEIDFKMPFFSHRSVIDDLKDSFVALEMKSAFSPDDADFSGVNGGRDLWISQITQLNELKVEAGEGTPRPSVVSASSFRSAGRYKNYRQARKLSIFRQRLARQDDDSGHEHHEEHEHIHQGHNNNNHEDDHQEHDHNPHSESSGENNDPIVRISFERQFMYAVRHNPTGMLVYIGRYYQPEEAIKHGSHSHH